MEVENTIPVLPVKSVKASKDFYARVLGFVVDWGSEDDATICQVSRDGQRLMLMEHATMASPACVWIGLESDRLFSEFTSRGVAVLSGPENKPWAYEMKILDVDGNILWLGTEPRTENAG